jgi:hypothetical protein
MPRSEMTMVRRMVASGIAGLALLLGAAPAQAADRACGAGEAASSIRVGPSTTCAFGQAMERHLLREDALEAPVWVRSPATGKRYLVRCGVPARPAGETWVTCRNARPQPLPIKVAMRFPFEAS